jgi:mannosyl-oligosaccharide alpha-1,2-mannosidase
MKLLAPGSRDPRRRRRGRLVSIFAFGLLVIFFLRETYDVRLASLISSYLSKLSPGPGRPPLRFKPSSFDWATVPLHHPPSPITPLPLPQGPPGSLPRVQHDFTKSPLTIWDDAAAAPRRAAVKDAFLRSWRSYKHFAWLHDELQPLSDNASDALGGWAATLVDSLDTLWVMGLEEEFYEAAAVAVAMDFNVTDVTGVDVFETTSRHLGGLLGAYEMSGERALLRKAAELGDMLYLAFDTPNRMPSLWLEFEDARAGRQVAG